MLGMRAWDTSVGDREHGFSSVSVQFNALRPQRPYGIFGTGSPRRSPRRLSHSFLDLLFFTSSVLL